VILLDCYKLNLYTYPTAVEMIPNQQVVQSGLYKPSRTLLNELTRMAKSRRPRVIGLVSERIVAEIICGGTLRLGNARWRLTCQRLEQFAAQKELAWRPGYGIRCDDLATLAEHEAHEPLLFITESKGTTSQYGLARDAEGKMFYQLARTFEKLKRTEGADAPVQLGGIISAIVNHYSRVITINVNDRTSSFAGGLPDKWMYPGKSMDAF
jgi:hypothetical protein